MYKAFSRTNLLAATALTGVVLFGGHQALAQGKAAKIKLSLSGGFVSLLGFGTQKASFEKSSDADVSGITHYEPFNIVNDSEIHVSGSVRLDNGMTASVVVEFEADQFTANGSSGGQGDKGIDDSYISLDGGFGQIRIGSTSPGSHDFANTAPFVGALAHDNADTDNWVVVPAASGLGSPGSDISDGNVLKIVYVTPSIAGFTLGAPMSQARRPRKWWRRAAAIRAPKPNPTTLDLAIRPSWVRPMSAPISNISGWRALPRRRSEGSAQA